MLAWLSTTLLAQIFCSGMAEKRLLMASGLCAMGLFSLATSQSLKTGLAVSDGKSWITLLREMLWGRGATSCRVQ